MPGARRMPKVSAAGYCPEARPTESGALVLRAGQAYSITSSARASSDSGMSMPSALAVFRFNQFVLGRRLYRQVSRFLTLEYAVDIVSGAAVLVDKIRPVGDQAAAVTK